VEEEQAMNYQQMYTEVSGAWPGYQLFLARLEHICQPDTGTVFGFESAMSPLQTIEEEDVDRSDIRKICYQSRQQGHSS
jgi:hypothetical protein